MVAIPRETFQDPEAHVQPEPVLRRFHPKGMEDDPFAERGVDEVTQRKRKQLEEFLDIAYDSL